MNTTSTSAKSLTGDYSLYIDCRKSFDEDLQRLGAVKESSLMTITWIAIGKSKLILYC